jgi:uncharacterized membrane protein YidH (DUF202 family)
MTRPGYRHPRRAIDAGLQSERTYLAWQRTGLTFAGVGALLLYSTLSYGPILAAPGALGLLFGALLVARAQWRYRTTVAAARNAHPTVDHRLMAGVAAAATLLCLAGLGALFS